MSNESQVPAFLRRVIPVWYLDTLLIWAVLTGSCLLMLWWFNNTTKAQVRLSIAERVELTTKTIVQSIGASIKDTDYQNPDHFESFFERQKKLIEALQNLNPDVLHIYLGASGPDGKMKVVGGASSGSPMARALHVRESDFQRKIADLMNPTVVREDMALSSWVFLNHQSFLFFTPPASESEYSVMSLPKPEGSMSGESLFVVVLFQAEKMRNDIAVLDTTGANLVAISLLMATAFSIIVRRRSVQREEALQEKLVALQILHQRDVLLAAAVGAADEFITAEDIRTPLEWFFKEVAPSVDAEAAYYLPLKSSDHSIVPPGQVEPLGLFSPEFPPLSPALFAGPPFAPIRQELTAGRMINTITEQAPEFLRKECLRREVRAVAMVPVITGGVLIGALILESRTRSAAWEGGLMDTFKLIADQLAAALERRQAERRLRQSNKVEALGRMAGGVAHEFNNLLHIISGNLANLSKSFSDNQEAGQMVEIIRKVAQRGSRIIDQVLRSTRQSVADLHSAPLNDLVIRTAELARSGFSKSVEIKIKTDPGIPPVIMDESLIQQVILNILINARDAVEDKGVIEVTSGVSIESPDGLRPRQMVYCSIRDFGPGIPPHIIDSIFDPFFTTKAPGKGTGLGLSTCRGILEQHRGFIMADNHPEKGAIFTFFLPLSDTDIYATKPIRLHRSDGSLRGKTALVADDEPFCLQLARDILSDEGVECLGASQGEEALEIAKNHPGRIDWIITDWTMPGESGAPLLKKFRAARPEARIILTSGFLLQDEDLPEVDGLLRKPFEPEDLLKALIQVSEQLPRAGQV